MTTSDDKAEQSCETLKNIYESVEVSERINGNARWVLLTSLALIALCVTAREPQEVDILGVELSLDWGFLGAGIALALLYGWVQLLLMIIPYVSKAGLAVAFGKTKIVHPAIVELLAARDRLIDSEAEDTKQISELQEQIKKHVSQYNDRHAQLDNHADDCDVQLSGLISDLHSKTDPLYEKIDQINQKRFKTSSQLIEMVRDNRVEDWLRVASRAWRLELWQYIVAFVVPSIVGTVAMISFLYTLSTVE